MLYNLTQKGYKLLPMAYLPGQPEAAATPAPEQITLAHTGFLQAATYDASQYTLTIAFKNGDTSIKRYVFPSVWEQFKQAPNHGSFYATQLKSTKKQEKYPTISLHKGLKVSDLKRAIKEKRPHGKI